MSRESIPQKVVGARPGSRVAWAGAAIYLILAFLFPMACSQPRTIIIAGVPGRAPFSLQDKVYLRDLGQRIALMADPDWSITDDDSQTLRAGNWQDVDVEKIDDIVALAAITSAEATEPQPVGRAVESVRAHWSTAAAQYSSSLSDLRAAIAQQDQGTIEAALAKVASSAASLSSVLDLYASATLSMPASPGGDQDLTAGERAYLARLVAADHALDHPLVTMEAALEAGNASSLSTASSLPVELAPRLLQACVVWASGDAPSDRLQEIGAAWDSVMKYARQAVDLAEQAPPGDTGASARLHVLLRLAIDGSREVRYAIAPFFHQERSYRRSSAG
jgi:hypothetical protein